MSDGMNKVILLGNLGADAELNTLPSGEKVCNLRMATTESWFDKEANQRQERTEWHSVSIYGKRGEAIAKYLKKGDRIVIEGSLRTKATEKEGVKHYNTSIVSRDVFFAGSAGGAKREVGPETASGDGGNETSSDEDPIPFDVPPPAASKKKK